MRMPAAARKRRVCIDLPPGRNEPSGETAALSHTCSNRAMVSQPEEAPAVIAGPAVRPKHKSRRTCWLELHSVSSASNAIKSTEHSKISGLGEKRAGKTASQLGLKRLGLRPLSATTLSGSTPRISGKAAREAVMKNFTWKRGTLGCAALVAITVLGLARIDAGQGAGGARGAGGRGGAPAQGQTAASPDDWRID